MEINVLGSGSMASPEHHGLQESFQPDFFSVEFSRLDKRSPEWLQRHSSFSDLSAAPLPKVF